MQHDFGIKSNMFRFLVDVGEILKWLKLVDLHVWQLFQTFHWVKRFRVVMKVDVTSMYVTAVFHWISSKLELYQYVQLCLKGIESHAQRIFRKLLSLKKYEV